MDKRLALFVVCVGLSFMGVQWWFGNRESQMAQARLASMEQREAALANALRARLASRSSLHLSDYFSDAKRTERLGAGVEVAGKLLSLSTSEHPPRSIFLADGTALTLLTEASLPGEPIVYGSGSTSPLELPPLPSNQTLDLQLVTQSGEVHLGELKGHQLLFPRGPLGESAIALMREGDTFLPVGVYDPARTTLSPLSDFKAAQSIVSQKETALPPPPSGEEFYILENEYQQLVFSTRGGALAEINFPLRDEAHPTSLIRPIELDRELLEEAPAAVRFPAVVSYRINANGKSEQIQEGQLGGYYPLLRRGISPTYYATTVRGADQLQYRVTRYERGLIQFTANGPSFRITKTYTLPAEGMGPYCFDLLVDISGDATGLALASGVPEVELMSGSFNPLLRIQITKGIESDVDSVSLPKKKPVENTEIRPNWISNSNGFFGILMDPLNKELPVGYEALSIAGEEVPSRLTAIGYSAEAYPGYETLLPLAAGSHPFRIFAGPYDEKLLKELDAIYEEPASNYNPEYTAAQQIQGWFSFISLPFTKFLYFLIRIFYLLTHSWGLSIILLTVALRAMMYPLNAWSIRTTVRMQEIAPKERAIRERYKKDPKRAQLETMLLYKAEGVNPLSGCIPALLQAPFLMGMFYLLKSSFPLRGAPFIPGWIDNLAAPDVVFSWGFHVPILGENFHFLPFLMGAAMYWQGILAAKPPQDPNNLTEQEKQQKLMAKTMPIVLTVVFYGFPSGLNIYLLSSTLLGIWQQKWMMKRMAPR